MKLLYTLVLLLISIPVLSQEKSVRNFTSFDEFLNEQQQKLELVVQGMTTEEVVASMGDTIVVKVPKVKRMKPLNKEFFQPYFISNYRNRYSKSVVVYWYFSTPKDENGVVSKRECTPVLMLENEVIGKGWDFFNSYRRSMGLRI